MSAVDVATPPEVVVHADQISKHYAGVLALDHVSLDIRVGEVLALVGENGAGKSTLLKILSGDVQPSSGELQLDGRRIHLSSPATARGVGIRVIAQEPEIIPHVSVAENLYAGALTPKGHIFRIGELVERADRDIENLGFRGVIRGDMLGEKLSPAQAQIVEIIRALNTSVRVVAFDEPTSSLSDHEVTALFQLVRRLQDDGVAIIYVSHRLQEIFRVATRVAVLRDGRVVGERLVSDVDEAEVVRMMVGRDLGAMFIRERRPVGEVVLSLRHVTTDDVRDVSFDVHAGEVVGLAGLVGAGRTELARAIVGDLPVRSGEVLLDGRRLHLHSPTDAVSAGIALAPEERKAQALLMQRSVRDNVSLAVLRRLSRFHVVNRPEERRLVRRFTERLRVRTPSIEREVASLSGGNQQKVVLARWLARRPRVLLLDEPTRGVDVGAKSEIYEIISDLCNEGVAILMISSELPEVIGLADRIVVMHDGRITGQLDRDEANEERLLTLAMGQQPDSPGVIT
jgi:L-arabinose transport system ATP-binding protein